MLIKLLIALCITIIHADISYANLIERIQKLKPAIVEIKTVYKKVINKKMVSYERRGAGIIIDPSGIIVTNTHTIIHAPQIIVTLSNGQTFEPQLLFASQDNDFSILKIISPTPLPFVEMANSQNIKLHDDIIAIGNSEFNSQSIMSGKITSIIHQRLNNFIEFLEVSLHLYKGDSGGPIFNTQGQLLGMVMAQDKMNTNKIIAIASNKIKEQYLKHQRRMR